MAVCKYCTVTNVLVLWTGALVLKPWVLQLKMDYSEQSSKKKKKFVKSMSDMLIKTVNMFYLWNIKDSNSKILHYFLFVQTKFDYKQECSTKSFLFFI